jgi:hypothetical protein
MKIVKLRFLLMLYFSNVFNQISKLNVCYKLWTYFTSRNKMSRNEINVRHIVLITFLPLLLLSSCSKASDKVPEDNIYTISPDNNFSTNLDGSKIAFFHDNRRNIISILERKDNTFFNVTLNIGTLSIEDLVLTNDGEKIYIIAKIKKEDKQAENSKIYAIDLKGKFLKLLNTNAYEINRNLIISYDEKYLYYVRTLFTEKGPGFNNEADKYKSSNFIDNTNTPPGGLFYNYIARYDLSQDNELAAAPILSRGLTKIYMGSSAKNEAFFYASDLTDFESLKSLTDRYALKVLPEFDCPGIGLKNINFESSAFMGRDLFSIQYDGDKCTLKQNTWESIMSRLDIDSDQKNSSFDKCRVTKPDKLFALRPEIYNNFSAIMYDNGENFCVLYKDRDSKYRYNNYATPIPGEGLTLNGKYYFGNRKLTKDGKKIIYRIAVEQNYKHKIPETYINNIPKSFCIADVDKQLETCEWVKPVYKSGNDIVFNDAL